MPMSTNRPTSDQAFQWGFDAIPRAGGSANRKFSELVVMPSLQGGVGINRGQAGRGAVTSTTKGIRRTSFKFDGPWNFNDMIAIFANHGNYAAPVVNSTESTAYDWTFGPSFTAVNTPKTGVAEWGDSTRVDSTSYIATHALKLEASRADDGLKMSGEMIGGWLTGPHPSGFTASPTRYAQATASPVDVDVYLVDDLSTISGTVITATKLPRAYKWSMDSKGMWVPDDPLNSTRRDFAGLVAGVQSTTVKITFAADDQGMALLDDLDEGVLKYFGLVVPGPAIGAVAHQFKFTQALKITKVPDYADIDPIHGIEVEAEPAFASAFNNLMYKAEIRSTLAAL